jgi:hypothetical protein
MEKLPKLERGGGNHRGTSPRMGKDDSEAQKLRKLHDRGDIPGVGEETAKNSLLQLGLGIRFKPTIRFVFSVIEKFGFLDYISRSVFQKTKTDMFGFGFFGSVFWLNRHQTPQFRQT